ncbi:MAG: 30S ribosomal protein S3 [Candidatus Kerfeldbacteria bacterium]|nr:30S ribosomal protein S3 [Candidatus Kerfeldbacteria bacterium]
MGQKTHPKAFRLGVNQTWNSKWFARKGYAALVREDVRIRKYVMTKVRDGGIAQIEIERTANGLTLTLWTSKPGVVIGRGGAGVEALRKDIRRLVKNPKVSVTVNIQEVRQPDLDAQIVVGTMVSQIEKRLPFRRVMKQAVDAVMRAGAQGVKVMLSGRLNGAEIARREKLVQGKLPLHTLRADIRYSRGTAHTTYGTIGVKVWIYRGEIFETPAIEAATTPATAGAHV